LIFCHRFSLAWRVSLPLLLAALQMGLNSLIFAVTQGIPKSVGSEICTVYLCDYSKSELWSVATGSGSEFRIPIGAGLAGHVRYSRARCRQAAAAAAAASAWQPMVQMCHRWCRGSLAVHLQLRLAP
jgi:hypothetical protein